jgi:hypothetical protein
MKSTKNISNLFRALAVVLTLTAASCSTQEDFVKPVDAPVVTTDESTAAEEESVASLTVTGTYTEFSDNAECATCTYVVPEDATVVDGSDFRPGDVICLNKAFKYKAIEFVNMEGTGESPITIANCGQ